MSFPDAWGLGPGAWSLEPSSHWGQLAFASTPGSGVILCKLTPATTEVSSAASQGRHLVFAHHDRRLTFWDLAESPVSPKLEKAGVVATAVALTNDASHIAFATTDRKVFVVESATGREVQSFAGHERPVLALTFNKDGTQLASESIVGELITWDLTTAEVLHRQDWRSVSEGQSVFDPANILSVSGNRGREIPALALAFGSDRYFEVEMFAGVLYHNEHEYSKLELPTDAQ